MAFNISKFLTENKLTRLSGRMEEDNEEIVDDTTETSDDVDDDYSMGDPEDTWNKPEPDDSADYEKEPTAKDVSKQEPALSGIHKKQAQLKDLTDKKDMMLMQYKSGQMGLDDYKKAIGDIPQQIKRLKDQIDQAMNVSVDDDSEEEAS